MKKINCIDCEVIKDLLPSYVENLSSNQTKEIIHNHVENCENCKQILEMLQKIIHLKP